MKIYIVGSGGVGGYFGGMLAKDKNDVTFVARGDNYEAIKKNGLILKSKNGNFTIKPAKIIKERSEIKDPGLILFTVKTYDTAAVSKELSTVVNQNTIIITVQNGVNNDSEIKKYINKGNVYPGLAYIISTKIAPGIIKQSSGSCSLIFGERKKFTNEKLIKIQTMMKKAAINATYSDDIERDIWKKYMFIVAYSGMTVICRSTIGRIIKNQTTKTLYERCAREAIQVAKAIGVNVAEDAFDTIMKVTFNTSPESKSSLLVDIENNRKNEIETLNGTLVKFGKEKNIDVPINEMIYGVIKLLNY